MLSLGVLDYVKIGTYQKIINTIAESSAEDITASLNKEKSSVDTMINRVNVDLKKVK